MNQAILALDVGGGTQDLVIYYPDQPVENAVKLVLPSPTVIAARRIRAAAAAGRPVYLSGRLMGGGEVGRAVREHLATGLGVYSLAGPALTLHDDLDRVRALGVEIVDGPPDGEVVEVPLGDLDLAGLDRALAGFEVERPEVLAVALQDHGFSPRASNRLTRFSQWRRFLESGGDIGALLFTRAPKELTRWVAAAEAAPGAFFMDTCAAALWGALLDEYAAGRRDRGLVVLNAGNEHTVGFLVRGREVWGVFEQHTSVLTPETLADLTSRFTRGRLTLEEVFQAGGHGAAYRPGYHALAPFSPMVVTGPRRALARHLGHLAAPHGEMMLSGCFGLIEAVAEHWGRRPAGA
ncbi:MAG: DUF1786 domain-containing protein [Thermodesulfobacteriota bacterium]